MALAPKAGRLLVATPGLLDPNFFRTVVLVCRHDDQQGTVGLVLNRPTEVYVGKVLPQIAAEREEPLWVGGPVDGRSLWVLHRRGDLEGLEDAVMDGVHFTHDPGVIRRLLASNGADVDGNMFRLFVGYAGWDVGQLEAELAEGAWHVVPTGPETLFGGESERLWHEMMLRSMLLPTGSPDVIEHCWLN